MKISALLEVNQLRKVFRIHEGFIFTRLATELMAVDNVSFRILPGQTLGLVGESGCGKTTVGKLLVRLIEPTAGQILFKGKDVGFMQKEALLSLRGRMQIVFQDPYSSLNPRKTVAEIIDYPLRMMGLHDPAGRRNRVHELLALVGLSHHHANRYPHQFSGGQRQRVGIARALAVDPDFIVLDEPVSALDVSIQAQIINLLIDLQDDLNLSYLFISHDLNVVEHLSDRVAVMYLGKFVEVADRDDLFQNPKHPYTQSLLSAVLTTKGGDEEIVLKGEIPSPTEIPTGCRFHTRCYMVEDICRNVEPEMKVRGISHEVACHFAD